MDAVIAQGYEAGGHRGVFDPDAPRRPAGHAGADPAAGDANDPAGNRGGRDDGRGGYFRRAGAGRGAAQLGTAFIACPESAADAAYRATLMGEGAAHTVMTRAISGRPARCLPNRFTTLAEALVAPVPDYPIAYDAGKALNAAARGRGEYGYGAQWAGQGAPLARAMPAAALVATIAGEIRR